MKTSGVYALSVPLVVGLIGCTAAPVQQSKNAAGTAAAGADFHDLQAYKDQYAATLDDCKTESKALRGSTADSEYLELTIATIGVVAGSVAVPALSAATHASRVLIAAVGGVSGAANGLQFAWNKEGQGSAGRASTYNSFTEKYTSMMTQADQATTLSDALTALRGVDRYCTITPPIPAVTDTTTVPKDAQTEALKAATDVLTTAKTSLDAATAQAKQAEQRANDAAAAVAAAKTPEEKQQAAEKASQAAQDAKVAASNANAQAQVVTDAKKTVDAATALKTTTDTNSANQAVVDANKAADNAKQQADAATKAAQATSGAATNTGAPNAAQPNPAPSAPNTAPQAPTPQPQ